MKSSIYISSEKIEVIGYVKNGKRALVKEYAQSPLPEGAMINGVITDPGALAEALRGMRAAHPELFVSATLLVDGSSILSKRVLVPRLNATQCDRLIRDEFSGTMPDTSSLVCGFQRLEGKPEAILAVAVDKAHVESYIVTFRDAGIKLAAIRVGVQAIMNFVAASPALQQQTFVLNIIEGVSVMSLVFDKGVNVFMSRTRLYSEDQEQFVESMHSSLSGLMQFNVSQNLGRITNSYYLGLRPEDLRAIREANPTPDVRLDALNIFSRPEDAEDLPPDAHLVYLGALLGDGSVDLIRSYRAIDRLIRKQKPKRRWIAVLAALALLLTLPISYLAFRTFQTMGLMSEAEDYLNDPLLLKNLEEINQIRDDTASINRVFSQLGEKESAEAGYVILTKGMLDLITRTMTDRVTVGQLEYTAETGLMRVTALALADSDPSAYVEALQERAAADPVFGIWRADTGGHQGTPETGYTFSVDVYFFRRDKGAPQAGEEQP